ncbi:MAG: AAA family ATPase [Deinococcales bacterium]
MFLSLTHQSVKPKHNFFVISGCSGSGKSTLLDALKAQGETVVMEAGRRVVKEQLELGLDGLPWENTQRFIELCVVKGIADFDTHVSVKGRVFFDRSLIEFTTAEAFGLQLPTALNEALSLRRYAPLVFMSPPWETLFQTDDERRHSFEDAVAEYKVLVPSYQAFGYQIVYLPQIPVEERVSFVLSQLSVYESTVD